MTTTIERSQPVRRPGRHRGGGVPSVRAAWLRLRRWPVTWVLVGAYLVLSLTFGYLFPYLTYRDAGTAGFGDPQPADRLLAGLLPESAPAVLVQGTPMFGGALVMILGALAVGSGYGWGTWKTAFTVGPRRTTLLGGTFAVLAAIVVGTVLVGFAAMLIVSAVIAGAESPAIAWPAPADAAQGLGSAVLVLGMWTAAGVLLGTLTRSPALAVGLGLVWTLFVENLLIGVRGALGPIENVVELLPGAVSGSVAGALVATPDGPPASATPGVTFLHDGGAAALLTGAYLVALTVVATVVTARRDLDA